MTTIAPLLKRERTDDDDDDVVDVSDVKRIKTDDSFNGHSFADISDVIPPLADRGDLTHSLS